MLAQLCSSRYRKIKIFTFSKLGHEPATHQIWSNYNDVVATWSKRTKVGKKSVFPNEIFGCQIGSY